MRTRPLILKPKSSKAFATLTVVLCLVQPSLAQQLQLAARPNSILGLGAILSQQAATPTGTAVREPHLSKIAALVDEAIAAGKMPGCVICFGNQKGIQFLKAFGQRKVVDGTEAMTTDTVFDLASLTKPVATATSVMQLLERGRLRLHSPVREFFPEFGCNGKENITLQHLLVHQSGLIPDNALRDYKDGAEQAWERICQLGIVAPVGKEFKYSDVNFIVLAKIVEKLSGKNIAEYSREEVFQPLGMNETTYNPGKELRRRTAVTEKRDGEWMRGQVHDPRAWELGGIAGHAGLFSTAEDLSKYATMMLGRGTGRVDDKPIRILSPTTFELMTSSYKVSRGIRGLGWDKQSPYSSNKGQRLSESAFGHGGFTGTVLWIDPKQDLFFVFLSNRVHPEGSGNVNQLAGSILNEIVDSLPRQN